VTPDIERLIGAAVRWAADSRVPVEVSAEAPIMVTSLDQPPRRVIHLVSLNGDTRYQDDRVATAGRVAVHVEIPPSRAIRRIRRLWAFGEVAAEIQGGRATVVLDEVGLYEVLDVQWR
jgi:hypothetical protein